MSKYIEDHEPRRLSGEQVRRAARYCGPKSFASHDGNKLWVYQADDLRDWDVSPHSESPDTRFSEAEGGEL